MGTVATLGRTPFAVVDLETTGIYAGQHDRIIEIAVVRLRPDLSIEDQWSTLVNPQRDIGSTALHGIQAGDVLHAPTFAEVAADAGQRLHGAVVVGHHLRFDISFLDEEYQRCGVDFPQIPGVCTLALAYRLLPDAPSRKLVYCCEQVGIRHENEHSASGDALATAHLLARLVDIGRRHGLTTLEEFGCAPIELPVDGWIGHLSPSGKAMARSLAFERQRDERSYLARLVERMPGDEARNARESEYLGLLDRVLEDHRITPDEAALLVNMATSWGMTRSDVLDAHRAYLGSLVSEALVDGVVTSDERRQLDEICESLGLHRASVDVLITEPARTSTTSVGPSPGDLRGRSVCFTGELSGRFKGEPITREIAEKLAADAGLVIRDSVTKKLDLLVVADPDTQSIKAKKARQYGVRIMAEARFWPSIGAPVT